MKQFLILILSIFYFTCESPTESEPLDVEGGGMVVYIQNYSSSNQQGLRLDIEEEYYLGWGYSSEFNSDSTLLSGDSVQVSIYKSSTKVHSFDDWYTDSYYFDFIIGDWGTGDGFRVKVVDDLGNFGYSQEFTIIDFSSETDLQVIQDIIDLNNLTPNDAPSYEPTELGGQTWSNGRLVSLDLTSFSYTNSIDSLPNSIGDLSMLNTLELKLCQSYSDTCTLPESIGYLTNLSTLKIEQSHLASLPESFGNLFSLNELDLDNNYFTEIPEVILKLTSLSKLYLSSNDITSIPDNIGDLTSLRYLYLNNNEITGGIPASIGDITNLDYFHIKSNQLTGMPDNICDLDINSFNYDDNYYCTSELPDCLLEELTGYYGSWKQYCQDENSDQQFLRDLIEENDIGSNIFYIGHQEWEYGRLVYLNLSCHNTYCDDWYHYDLTVIPESISNCTALQYLLLTCNDLSTLPPQIGNLNSLVSLQLSRNNLTSLPDEICNLPFFPLPESYNVSACDGDFYNVPHAPCSPSDEGGQGICLGDNNLTGTLPECLSGTYTYNYDGCSTYSDITRVCPIVGRQPGAGVPYNCQDCSTSGCGSN